MKETFDVANSVDSYKFKIWRREKEISINKSLLAFRITQFLWFGAGCLPSLFLGIFIKQRGLALIEISSVYSIIFLFQFITCFITGIITDKMGDAKPVIIFLMLSTCSVLVSMSLTPNINSVSCPHLNETLVYSNISAKSKNSSSCYNDCLLKNQRYFHAEENYTENSFIENAERFDLVIDNNKSACDFSSILRTNNSSDLPKDDDCCIECESSSTLGCIKSRKSYLVAVYAVLILAFYSVWSTTYRFMNFSAVLMAAATDSHFGKEVAIARTGELPVIIITAFVIATDKSSGSEISFDPVIWIAAAIMFCAFLSFCMNTIPILPPGENLKKKAFGLMKDVDILAFVLLVFIAGNGYAFNFTFHLVFFEYINAPSIVVALHSVVVSLYGFPLLITSNWWLKKFGTNKLFVLCLLFYTLNNAAYSFISNPWWFLIIDITVAFTDDLFWVAVVVHCQRVAPAGFAATLNALTGSVHFGMGRSSGVFFGGMMMSYMGPRKAYRIMAGIFFTAALLYSIFMYKRRKPPPVDAPENGNETADTKHSKNTDTGDV